MKRLREANIDTVTEMAAGATRYCELRSDWQPFIEKLGRSGAFDPHEIDPSTARPR